MSIPAAWEGLFGRESDLGQKPLLEPQKQEVSFKWATVESLAPVRVRLDRTSAPLAAGLDSLVDPGTLDIGTRVWCQLVGRRVIILGTANGGGTGGGGGGIIGHRRGGVAPAAIPNAAITTVSPGGVVYSYGAIANASGGGILIEADGWYDVIAQWSWANPGNSTGTRQLRINVNGAAAGFEQVPGSPTGNLTQNATWGGPLEVGDTVHMAVYHNSGAPLSGVVFSGSPFLVVSRKGPLAEQTV